MEKFLESVAKYVYRTYGRNLGDLTIIFPNRRASLFFQKYLEKEIVNPVFVPNMTTIGDFVSSLSDYEIVDHNRQVIELYHIFVDVTQSAESLDDFYYWGEMMLSDFNEIDKYLVDASRLFQNIEDLESINSGYDFLSEEQLKYLSSFWDHLLSARDSSSKSDFLNIWKCLYSIYKRFREKLIAKEQACEGMIYRDMAENLIDRCSKWIDKPVCIVGLNALNECEHRLLNFLKVNAQTCFFWDYDSYYVDQKNHEAGVFMRDNLRKFPMPADFIVDFDNIKKMSNIDVISITGNTGQTVYTSRWLEQNKTIVTGKFDNTALVLCDENLLTSVIQTLPDFIKDVNITMGYPFRASVVYSLVSSIADIDKNSSSDVEGNSVFYYKHVLSLLGHPMMQLMTNDSFDKYYRQSHTQRQIYLKTSDFVDSQFLYSIFNLPKRGCDCRDYFRYIIDQLLEKLPEESVLEKETLYLLGLSINQLHDSLFVDEEKDGELISKRLFFKLLLKYLDGLSIPFEGEPLNGLQIIGILETRCLDFDNVILLSALDSNLPGNTRRNSYIPYTLRKGFGLPLYEHRQSMYAYYFYRLLQRAKHVSLVYDNRTDKLGKGRGEVSRYVTQLKYEAPNIRVNELVGTFGFDIESEGEIMIKKEGRVAELLDDYFLNNVASPSAINTFLDCELKFYYKYIEKIKEPDEIVENIDNVTFGLIVHSVIEKLYSECKDGDITSAEIDSLLNDKLKINRALMEALTEYLHTNTSNMDGDNTVIVEVILKLVNQILRLDKTIAPFRIIALEEKCNSEVTIEANNKIYNVKIGGIIDRVDKVLAHEDSGQNYEFVRVVDYKTGKSDVNLSSVDDMFGIKKTTGQSDDVDLSEIFGKTDRNKAAFQTMLYAYCYHNSKHPQEQIYPAVYGVRAMLSEDFSPLFNIDGNNLVYQRFSDAYILRLKQLLSLILDSKYPFRQTTSKCEFCAYKDLCNR